MVGVKQYPHIISNLKMLYNFQMINKLLNISKKIFSEESLNKELYLRNRIHNGKMEVEDLAKYNDYKSNKIDKQKIIDLSKIAKI